MMLIAGGSGLQKRCKIAQSQGRRLIRNRLVLSVISYTSLTLNVHPKKDFLILFQKGIAGIAGSGLGFI